MFALGPLHAPQPKGQLVAQQPLSVDGVGDSGQTLALLGVPVLPADCIRFTVQKLGAVLLIFFSKEVKLRFSGFIVHVVSAENYADILKGT